VGRKVPKAAVRAVRKARLPDPRVGRKARLPDPRVGRKARPPDHRAARRAGRKGVRKAALQLAAVHLQVQWDCLRAVCLVPSLGAPVAVQIPAAVPAAAVPAVPLQVAVLQARWAVRKRVVAQVSQGRRVSRVARVVVARWAVEPKAAAPKAQGVNPVVQVRQAMRVPR
jgi:hypothetical protein